MAKKQVNTDDKPSSPTTKREETPTTSPKAVKTPLAPRKKTSSSASYWLVAVSLLALAVAFGVGHQLDRPSAGALQLQRLARRVVTTFQSVAVHVETAVGSTPDKYKTNLVHTTVRTLLDDVQCTDEAYTPSLLFGGRKSHVTDAMDGSSLTNTDKIFFMLNGANEGLYVSWNKDFNCVSKAAAKAAQWLGADADEIDNGVRLYTQMGEPIRNADELAASRHLVHILLDFQLWQWPGIYKGYKYVLDDGVTLTMVGTSPKVFDVEFFLTATEATQIRALGEPSLNRSKVDGSNSSSVVSQSRTSHTAFLNDDAFTREFRRRSAHVARLPSPSYAERLQLVRYAAGEFYRQHLDTFHSRDFLPKGANRLSMDDYATWAKWARATLEELATDPRVPEDFKAGGKLFPNEEDDQMFPNAFLELFYQHAVATNYFVAESDQAWETWLRENLDKDAKNILPGIMKEDGKPHYLPIAIRAWEEKLGMPELRYTFPKSSVNGVTHLFRWVRWAKERISFLGDHVPAIARHEGELFPKYTIVFQSTMLDFVLDDYSEELLTKITNAEWYKWMVENRGRNHVLFQAVQTFPHLTELAIRSWEARVNCPQLHYTMPKWVRHFHPQRYVTLFLYLNNETKIGGETVFPHSLDRLNDEHIERTGMDECSRGLAVPPKGLHASLFYVQTPEGEVDHMSRHGGCPPHEGIKWGSNSFMWNADADEGADLWTTKPLLDAMDVESNNFAVNGHEDEGDSLPNYMRPNFTSLLPEYANAETDAIRSAFTTNNFHSLQKLPPKLTPNAVNLARFESMDANRLFTSQTKTPKLVTKNGLFNAFEYTPSRFSLADELATIDRLASEAKRQAISGTDFVSTSDAKKLKYEDTFGRDPQFMTYPHLYEPYPDLRDEQRHAKWLEDKKILHGAFVPSGYRPPVDAITRLVLPELMVELHEVLATDWPDAEFSIAVTDDDNLAVRFSEATLDCVETGLIAYMNVLVKSHRVATKYKLQKVAEDWNAKPGDGGLYFVFRPPWVKNRSRDVIALVPK